MDPEIEVNTPERDYESEARAQGWKPQEEYQGENWVDAKTFVERGDKYVGILKDRFDKVERRLKYQEELNEDLKRQYLRLEKQRKKEVDDLVKQLEKERRQAITNGDGEAFDRAEKALTEVKEVQQEMEKAPVNNQEEPPKWAVDWMQENEWYGKDRALTALAESYAEELRRAQPWLVEREFMEQVAQYVKTEMPHKFQKKNKKQAADVEIDDRRPSTSQSGGKKTYNALPPEAKKEFNRFVREGIFKDTDADRKQYADMYFEDE